MVDRAQLVMAGVVSGVLLGSPVSGQVVRAAPADTAPASLVETLEALEAAANAQDIDQVMAFYREDFQGPDGFTRDRYRETLAQFWRQHSDLTYEVRLLSWDTEADTLIAETLTTVTGTRLEAGREFTLSAQVRSRQHLENGQVVAQAILSEQSRLASGSNPPSVIVQLPERISPGQTFNFDAIVAEPLGDRLLLGRAVDEGVTAEDFLIPRPITLEQLSAGGLFKIGKAPDQPDQRWISAVLVRSDGLVIETRRLQVGNE